MLGGGPYELPGSPDRPHRVRDPNNISFEELIGQINRNKTGLICRCVPSKTARAVSC